MYAHCNRSGEIEFHRRKNIPGLLLIGQGSKSDLEARTIARARHAYDGETLLVPGLPEAETDEQAFTAVEAFQVVLKRQLAVIAA
jgi:hypothetical protein